MAETFEDRVEAVLGELHGMAWPLLEESDKRKIVGKVVRGIDKYGDTAAAWGRALGVARQTLSDRIAHFRRSEPIDSRAQDKENRAKAVRHAKVVMRDPESAADVIGSLKPAERAAVFGALEATEKNPVARPSTQPAKGSAKARNAAALAALADMHRAAQKAVDAANFGALDEHQLANAEVLLRYTEAEIEVWRERVGGGVSDQEIAALMAEGV